MLSYIVKRVLWMIPTLFAIVLLVFVLVNIAPGMPGQSQSANASESAKDSANARESYRLFKQQYHLDKPILLNTRWRLGVQDVTDALETVARASTNLTGPESLARHVARQSARYFERRLAAPRIALEQQRSKPGVSPAQIKAIDNKLQGLPPAHVSTPTPPRPPQRAVIRAQNHLENWGQSIVPELVLIATRYVALQNADGTHHSTAFLAEDEPGWHTLLSGALVPLVHSKASALRDEPSLRRIDYALTFKTRYLAIQRLAVNARRTTQNAPSGLESAEQRATNREIVRENDTISGWVYALNAPVNTRLEIENRWRAWYQEHRQRYARDVGTDIRTTFLDTRFAYYMANLIPFSLAPRPHFRAPRLGMSMRYRRPVLEVIRNHWRYSIALSVISLLLAYLIAVPIGVVAAVRHNGPIADRGIGILLFILYSFPVFFGATLLQTWLTPARGLPWFPVSGFDDGHPLSHTSIGYLWVVTTHLILPVVCLTYPSLAALSRYARSGLLEVIRADYVRTARAKGLPGWIVVTRHTVRNGIIPIITLLGSTLPVVIGGSIVIEYIFAINGMGALMLQSINQRDYNVILGVLLLSAVLTLIGILLSDIAYALVDPRISYD